MKKNKEKRYPWVDTWYRDDFKYHSKDPAELRKYCEFIDKRTNNVVVDFYNTIIYVNIGTSFTIKDGNKKRWADFFMTAPSAVSFIGKDNQGMHHLRLGMKGGKNDTRISESVFKRCGCPDTFDEILKNSYALYECGNIFYIEDKSAIQSQSHCVVAGLTGQTTFGKAIYEAECLEREDNASEFGAERTIISRQISSNELDIQGEKIHFEKLIAVKPASIFDDTPVENGSIIASDGVKSHVRQAMMQVLDSYKLTPVFWDTTFYDISVAASVPIKDIDGLPYEPIIIVNLDDSYKRKPSVTAGWRVRGTEMWFLSDSLSVKKGDTLAKIISVMISVLKGDKALLKKAQETAFNSDQALMILNRDLGSSLVDFDTEGTIEDFMISVLAYLEETPTPVKQRKAILEKLIRLVKE